MLATDPRYKYLVDIIMPNSCAVCGKVIVWDKLVCDECSADMPDMFDGFILAENTDGAVGVFYYEGAVIDLIYRSKHGGAVNNFAELCAGKLAERLDKRGISHEIDLVTAVPMHRRKKLARGQNHAERAARFVADKLSRPVDFSLLERSGDTTEQHKLEKEERRYHAENVYKAAKCHSDIKGKTILLCDDVITTGSTISACAERLRQMGAAKVYACSAAVSAVYRDSKNMEHIIP